MQFMEFALPQQYQTKLSEKYYLDAGERYLYLHFELVESKRVVFHAGQYLNVQVDEAGSRRAFSFVNAPDTDHSAIILAEVLPAGKASQMFVEMQPGDACTLLAPLGRFVVDETKPGKSLLFVATGSGIAPLYSMINDLLRNKRETRPMRLHWGLRREEDIFWLDNFERLSEEYDNFVFDLVLSKPSEGWELCFGHVQDCIRRDLKDLSEWEAYISGNRTMIQDVRELVVSMGLPQERVYTEQFYSGEGDGR